MRYIKNKYLLIAIVVFLLGWCSYYLLSPYFIYKSPINNEATSSWKEFVNTKFGYSLKYPSDWKLRSEDSLGKSYILSNSEHVIEFQDYSIYSLNPGQTMKEYLENVPGFKSLPVERIAINGYTAYIRRAPDGGELDSATYLKIEHNNKYLSIAIIKGNFEDVAEILNTIIFK